MDRRQALARGQELPERTQGTTLFADISGFTALTERLAQQGPAGAETLTHLLNTYFDQLIDLITDSGGDVVKFAGDALIVTFPAQPDGGRWARAVHCVLRENGSRVPWEVDRVRAGSGRG